jgi:transposase
MPEENIVWDKPDNNIVWDNIPQALGKQSTPIPAQDNVVWDKPDTNIQWDGIVGAAIEPFRKAGQGIRNTVTGQTNPLSFDTTFTDRTAQDLLSGGIGGTAESVGQGMQWLGAKETGKKLETFGQKQQKKYAVDNPTTYDEFVQSVGTSLPLMGGGIAASAGLGVAGVPAGIATMIAALGMAGIEGLQNAGSTRDQALKNGMSEQEANKAATKHFITSVPISVVMNKFGIFGNAKNYVLKLAKSFGFEATEEGQQQFFQNIYAKEPDKWAGVVKSAIFGGIMGLGGGALEKFVTDSVGESPIKDDKPTSPPDIENTPKQGEQFTKEIFDNQVNLPDKQQAFLAKQAEAYRNVFNNSEAALKATKNTDISPKLRAFAESKNYDVTTADLENIIKETVKPKETVPEIPQDHKIVAYNAKDGKPIVDMAPQVAPQATQTAQDGPTAAEIAAFKQEPFGPKPIDNTPLNNRLKALVEKFGGTYRGISKGEFGEPDLVHFTAPFGENGAVIAIDYANERGLELKIAEEFNKFKDDTTTAEGLQQQHNAAVSGLDKIAPKEKAIDESITTIQKKRVLYELARDMVEKNGGIWRGVIPETPADEFGPLIPESIQFDNASASSKHGSSMVIPINKLTPETIKAKLASTEQLFAKPLSFTKVKGSPTKFEKVPIFKDKEQLLSDIQKAIPQALDIKPDVSVQVGDHTEYDYPVGTPLISFKMDGGAKIYNTKHSLTEFYNRVKKTPESMSRTDTIKPLYTIQKPTPYKPKLKEYVPIKELGWHTDGRILMKGALPRGTPIRENASVDNKASILPVLEQAKTANIPAEFDFYGYKNKGKGEDTTSDMPIKAGDKFNVPAVILKAGDKFLSLDQNYYAYVREKYPNAKMFTDGKQVVFKQKDETVAIIMALQDTYADKPKYREQAPEPGGQQEFYSKLQRTIQEKMPESATAQQIQGIIKDTKAEERKWSGIDEFIAGKPKVRKQELLDYLKGNEYTPENIANLYSKGFSQLDIARKFNVTQGAISYHLLKSGIETRPFAYPFITQETKDNIIKLYKEGKRYRDIIKELEVSSSTIKDTLDKNGIIKRHGHKNTIDESIKKEAVRLYAEEEMSTQEIADRLNISAFTGEEQRRIKKAIDSAINGMRRDTPEMRAGIQKEGLPLFREKISKETLQNAQVKAEILKLNKEIFGDEKVNFMAKIIENPKALAMYRENMIGILAGKADMKDSFYHEAVHKYLDMFATNEERVGIYTFVKNKYRSLTALEVEEKVAEEFINYAKKRQGLLGKIKMIFDAIIRRIKAFLGKFDKVKNLYDDILRGEAKNRQARGLQFGNVANREVTQTKLSNSSTGNTGTFDPKNPDIRYRKNNPIFKTEAKDLIELKSREEIQVKLEEIFGKESDLEAMDNGDMDQVKKDILDKQSNKYKTIDKRAYENQTKEEGLQKAYDSRISAEPGTNILRPKTLSFVKEAKFREATPEKKPAYKETAWLKLREKIEDDWVRVKKMIQAPGVLLNTENNPYNAEIRYWGRIGARVEKAEAEIDSIDKAIGDLTPLVNKYLVARHAPERNAALGDNAAGMTNSEASAIMRDIDNHKKSAEIKKLAERIQSLNNQTLDVLLEGEVITQELHDDLRKKYPHHVPLQRVMENDDIVDVLTNRGFAVQGSGIKRAKGSELEVADILTNVSANLHSAISRAEKNIVDNHTYKFAVENDMLNGMFEDVLLPMMPVGKIQHKAAVDSEFQNELAKFAESLGAHTQTGGLPGRTLGTFGGNTIERKFATRNTSTRNCAFF